MEKKIDYKKYAIVYVDDEEKSLEYFKRVFEDQFRIITASNAKEGYRIFEEHKDEVAILITDQRMPGEKGVNLLQRVRRASPRVLRMLVTAYSDLDAAIDAVNSGAIYKYINKPWSIPELRVILKHGLEFFIVQQERDQLLQHKLSVINNIVVADRVISLGILATGLGHYVRNSMTAVRTFLDLAPDRLKEENVDIKNLHNPNFWKEFYEQVQNQVSQILKIFNDISVSSEDSSSVIEDQLHLRELIETVLNKLSRIYKNKDIKVNNHISKELPALTGEKIRFHRLFDLLINNVISSLPAGSEININARELATFNGYGPKLQIEIKDNGPGLPQDELRSLFYPFNEKGKDKYEFGINLLACYFIVYHHGGNIEVKSEENGGMIFTLTFRTKPRLQSTIEDESKYLTEVMVNEKMWERMLAEY